jgi:hypothetical protein
LIFEANRGQTDAQVQFLSRSNGYTLFLTPTEAVMELSQPRTTPAGAARDRLLAGQADAAPGQAEPKAPSPAVETAVLRMQVVGGNAAAQVLGRDELPTKVNYYHGSDPSKWRTDIPTYARVEYRDIYPGINLAYYGTNLPELEYDFVIAPGANPAMITLGFGAVDQLQVDAQGDLLVSAGGEHIRHHKPFLYQEVNGVRQEIAGRFVLRNQNQVSFAVGPYDTSQSLVIDPVLSYSTYLGGSGTKDAGMSIAVDAQGNAYVGGYTNSTNFPTTAGAFSVPPNGNTDVFVTKINARGTALIYSSVFGGGVWQTAYGHLAVDSAGNVYFTGGTSSPDFPTTPGAFQQTLRSSVENAYVVKLNSDGSLGWSTYLGGSGPTWGDVGYGVQVDASGNVYAAGYTSSSDFPTTPGAFQPAYRGTVANAYLTKLNSTGSALLYSTYLGGSGDDGVRDFVLDRAGNLFVTGWTNSPDFPVTPGVFQPTYAGTGRYNAFVAKVNTTNWTLVYSTYLGGSGLDAGRDIAVDASGNAYVTGDTLSTDFPTKNPLQAANAGGIDAFVTKLNATGSALLYSTYLGGSGDDQGWGGIGIDAAGNAYVMGSTTSTDFPTRNAVQPRLPAGLHLYVAKLTSAGSALVYSTYLGGSDDDAFPNQSFGGIAVDAAGNVYVTGVTDSRNFPTTSGAFQRSIQPGYHAFVTKISP